MMKNKKYSSKGKKKWEMGKFGIGNSIEAGKTEIQF